MMPRISNDIEKQRAYTDAERKRVALTVHLDSAEKMVGTPDCGASGGYCPHCNADLATGFGLAGGGYGVYEYCPDADCPGYFAKTDTPE